MTGRARAGGSASSIRAFTLIELLVVIAIIAILAAILFPVISAAKERGRQAKCLSNLKQLAAAMQNYADDNSGMFPKARIKWGGPPTWEGHKTLAPGVGIPDPPTGQLWPYVRSGAVYVCPSIRKTFTFRDVTFFVTLTYSMNCRLFNHRTEPKRPVTLSEVRRPTKVLLLIHEKTPNDGDFKWVNDDDSFTHAATDQYSDIHYDGTTLVYVDGHALWKSVKKLDAELHSCIWDPYGRLQPKE